LQVCLTVFVVLEVATPMTATSSRRSELTVLATLGSLYSILIAVPGIRTTGEAYGIFGKIGVIQMIDVIVNVFIPLTLVVSGFMVIINETNFIDAVLNATALIFIPEIDDQLPGLLGYDENAVIENYLIKEAKIEYNEYLRLETADGDIGKKFANDHGLGVEFNDYFITNSTERGRSPQDFALYQPFIVKKKNDQEGHEIDPSNYITEDCLLKSVEWRYTKFGADDVTTPRIGWLKVVKLSGEEVEIHDTGDEKILLRKDCHYLPDGVYVITSFVMSSSVLKLRLCGSKNAMDFLTAMDYYSLWETTSGAKKLLRMHKDDDAKEGHEHTA